MSYLQCTECGHVELESEILVESVWNPDIPGFDQLLLCRCGSREGGFETAYECESCSKILPHVDCTDLCTDCYNKHISLDRDLTALENERVNRI